MDKNDKTKDRKPVTTASDAATTEAQKGNEMQKNKFSASAKFSDSVVASEALKKRVAELENQVKRVLADYQNLEKRVAEERKEWVRGGNKELLLRLLPVLDTLILAAKHSKDEGLTLSTQQFLSIFKQEGVEKIETVGKNFDPTLMECVDTQEGEDGRVLQEIRAGYKLYDIVLRAALVKVGKKKIEQKEN